MTNNIDAVLRGKLTKIVNGLPRVLANEAVNHALDAIKAQEWDGQQWRRRIYRKGQGRSILIKSGAGRRSIKVVSVNGSGFIYGSDMAHMAAHNAGFTGTVNVKSHSRNKYKKVKVATGKFNKNGTERKRSAKELSGSSQVKAHSRRMNLPKRQFAGRGQALIDRLITKGNAYILKQFNY